MGFKNTLLPVATTIRSKDRLLDLSAPIVMGILNTTPDSFFSSSMDLNSTLEAAGKMLDAGAGILDIGGASTRPGAQDVPVAEEMDRVLPVITSIRKAFPNAWLSVDTFHAKIAEAAVNAGADIINDISSGMDPDMLEVITKLHLPYIAMHMKGTPGTMQTNPEYKDVVQEVFDYLKQILLKCHAAGINDVILDPGFGFGKTVSHNYALLDALSNFRVLGRPILAGLSRKSMICKPLHINPSKALNGTTALHMAALREGASILRVHDVREAMETIALFEWIRPE